MAFRKAMTGGACQADGTASGLNQNALTNMLDNFITGDANARQRMEGYGPQQHFNQQNMNLMEQQYMQMMNQEMMNQEFMRLSMQEQTNHFQHIANQNHQQINLNSLWDSQQSFEQKHQAPDQFQQIPYMDGSFQQPWMRPMMQQPFHFPPPQTFQQPQPLVQQQKEEQPKEEQKSKKEDVKDTTGSMIEVLENSSNPKFRNSKLLKFLKKLNTGAYEIQDDKLVKNKEKLNEFKIQEIERLAKEKEMNTFEEEKKEQRKQEIFKSLWSEDQNVSDSQMEELMQMWQSEGNQMNMEQEIFKNWGNSWLMDEAQPKTNIKFEENNPFMDKDDNLALAKQLYEDNRSQDAIICLQAEVQKSPENAEAWRLMGQIYQENDQDDLAIVAFNKAYEIDPYDLDSLLCLGISCTNELNEREATHYLSQWLKYHPDFNGLPEVQADNQDFESVNKAFETAYNMNNNDPHVLLALGVLSFIQRNYKLATHYFESAIKLNPTDHTLWNKYGAALANSLETDRGIEMYQQALEIRPNYVRTLANIGLGYNSQGQFEQAIPYFLNALVLNPQAVHIWKYLDRALVITERHDLIEKAKMRDPNAFRDQFKLVTVQTLPKPSHDKLQAHAIWDTPI